MAQPSKSLFRRIRSAKSSLDNAEQSFLDNKNIRGELDLMLAEAELQNLRKKESVPWSWSRQALAALTALLFVLAGVGGWYFARGHYKQRARNSKAVTQSVQAPVAKTGAASAQNNPAPKTDAGEAKAAAADLSPERPQLAISKSELHKLVRSARTELSNSK